MFRRPDRVCAGRSGLTLLELVVVMAILVALAGLVVPLMPALFSRASTTAGATNIDEIDKAIQLYATQHNDLYPNNLDSLVDGSGSLLAQVPYPSWGSWFSSGSSTLSADRAALSTAGISRVVQMIPQPSGTIGDWNPTYFPYGSDASVAPTAGSISRLAYVNPSVAAGLYGVPADGRYVIFGLGKYSTIAGVGMPQAPVYYSATNGYDPDHRYARFGLVFQTAGAGGAALTTARYLGAVAIDYYNLMNTDRSLYQNQLVGH